MDSTTLLKVNAFLVIVFLSLDNDDENDAFYIKSLLGLGTIVGVIGFLSQPVCPTVPVCPPVVPPPPVVKPPVVPPPVVTPPPVVPPPPVVKPPVVPPPVVTPPPVVKPPVNQADLVVTIDDPQPYHAGSVLFKRSYKTLLTSLNQIFIRKCFETIPIQEIKTPTKAFKIFLNNYPTNCFVSTNGIYINLEYLENLYTKHSVNNNIDSLKNNFLNELFKAYIEFVKLPSGTKQVPVRDVLVANETKVNITSRTRELVDNRDIYGFAARNVPFKFEHLSLTDTNYTGSPAYKRYKELFAPVGISETDYYLIVAREISNLLNPGEIKTALHDTLRRVNIRINQLAPGTRSRTLTYTKGDKKDLEWDIDYILSINPDAVGTQKFLDTVFHETTHCVDHAVSKNNALSPSYVNEGLAVWCENKIKGVSWAKFIRPKINNWRESDEAFAALLEYINRNNKDFVVNMFNLKVNNGYTEAIIKNVSGKSGDEWWSLYLANPDKKL